MTPAGSAPGHTAVLDDGHVAYGADLEGLTCARCGREIWWPGPGPYDYEHSDVT